VSKLQFASDRGTAYRGVCLVCKPAKSPPAQAKVACGSPPIALVDGEVPFHLKIGEHRRKLAAVSALLRSQARSTAALLGNVTQCNVVPEVSGGQEAKIVRSSVEMAEGPAT
jgi:hypothetical protein